MICNECCLYGRRSAVFIGNSCRKTGGLAALGSGQGGPAPKANMLGLADAENLIFTANCNRDMSQQYHLQMSIGQTQMFTLEDTGVAWKIYV